MNILVIGGAGYIGSHMVKILLEGGHQVTVLDNLTSGHRDAVLGGRLVEGELGDPELLESIFTQYSFDAVMHFAGLIQVGESVCHPDRYYSNNVGATLILLNTMLAHQVKYLVFSSTAAIFGEPEYIPINESHPKIPVNPYGRSKYIVEQILADYDSAFGLKSACLRYFNAAGSDPSATIGERHDPETHLIPIALEVASGQRDYLFVYGDDYDTPDGTCVRDYIHVNDLCAAHLQALEYMQGESASIAVNLGNGQGFSVREVIDTIEKVCGCPLPVKMSARRTGDPARLVADSQLARSLLGWTPHYQDLETIIKHAWQWTKERKARQI